MLTTTLLPDSRRSIAERVLELVAISVRVVCDDLRRRPIRVADRIDPLCALVKWHAVRVLQDALSQPHARDVSIRVITTYVGSTERRAVDELVLRVGATVEITYELDPDEVRRCDVDAEAVPPAGPQRFSECTT